MTQQKTDPPISVIVPALNEVEAIASTVESIRRCFAGIRHEIIVVDDGSTDGTGAAAQGAGAKVVQHPAPGGYGNAIKSGIYAARYDVLGIIDGDGTYPTQNLVDLYHAVAVEGYHMAVGARRGKHYLGGTFKRPARRIFTLLAQFSSGRRIPDANSGMRVFRKQDVMLFYDTLCSGFSFTTTITLAYMIKGYFIKYVPIEYGERNGKSKVHHLWDSLGTFQIIVQSIIYYNPLKIFLVLNIFLIIGFILCCFLLLTVDKMIVLLVFLFSAFFILILGMGFTTVCISFLANLVKETNREKQEFSHFKSQLDTCMESIDQFEEE
jgi:glycosyltransferase involved in cell wall biosynthesis